MTAPEQHPSRVAAAPDQPFGSSAEALLAEADDDSIVIGEGVALDVRPAGFMLRAVSAVIDAIVVYLLLIGLLLATFMSWRDEAPDTAFATAIIISTMVFCFVVVPTAVDFLTRGRSLGKLVMGLRVVRDDGGATSFRHALVRGLAGAVDFYLSAGAVAVVVGILSPRGKRLGDLLAGTYAQRERVRQPQLLVGTIPPHLVQWAGLVDVARMPDRTSRRILDYLEQAPHMDPSLRFSVAGRVAREARPYVHPIPDVDADTFLRSVAVVRRDRELAAHAAVARQREARRPVLEGLPFGLRERG